MGVRTNPAAKASNLIKNYTPRLCERADVFGTVSEFAGNIGLDFSSFLRSVPTSGMTATVTSSDGEVATQDYSLLQALQAPNLAVQGLAPWTVHVRFGALPGNGCSCLPEVEVVVNQGGRAEIDQRLNGFPALSGTVSKTIGTKAFAFGAESQISLDLTSESIAEGATYSANLQITNTGDSIMYITLQDITGDITGTPTFNNTVMYAVQPGETLPFGAFVLDTATAGSKAVNVSFYGNLTINALKQISLNYTVV